MTQRNQPIQAHYAADKIHVTLANGLEIAFPIRGNPRLEGNPHQHLDHIELSPHGLHWPDLDEDLSIEGILAGDFGQGVAPPPRRLGEAAGQVRISDRFDEPLPDFDDYQ